MGERRGREEELKNLNNFQCKLKRFRIYNLKLDVHFLFHAIKGYPLYCILIFLPFSLYNLDVHF